ncbi:hypothetical protein EQJ94_26595, partial [Escherichia coli]|nr:hypothetical protein [Escherichia coli]
YGAHKNHNWGGYAGTAEISVMHQFGVQLAIIAATPITTSCKRKAAKILYIIEPVIGLLQRTEDS